MESKPNTKTIVIAILAGILLILGIAGSIVFLKDSGEAAAIDEANSTTYSTAESQKNDETIQKSDDENESKSEDSKATDDVEDEQSSESGVTQNTKILKKEPAPSYVERERVISQEKKLGWSKIGLNNKIGSLDIKYNNLKYKVEYYFDGTIDETLTEKIKGNKNGAIINSYTDNAKIGYSLKNVENFPLTITENNSKNIIKVYYKINQYTATFELGNGERNVVKVQDYGTKLEAPTPEKEGYTFKGWDSEVPSTMPAEDKKYTAQWEINKYTATFKLENGESDVVKVQDYGTKLEAPTPTKEGYTFKGWDNKVPANMPAENKTYTAQWEVNKYTATFELGNGERNVVKVQDYGTKLEAPTPEKEGYTFKGWDSEVPSTMPAEDKKYTAQWEINKYTATFKLENGESDVVKVQDYGTKLEAPTPTKEGYTFKGWDNKVPANMPAENKTYTAQWEVNKYTATFELGNGERNVVKVQDYGTKLEAPTPEKEGYTFKGWDSEVPSTMPAEDKKYIAQWEINKYTATFKLENGESDVVKVQDYGTKLEAPTPTKEGYTFKGWDNKVPANMPAENKTYTAQWEVNKYTATFELGNGEKNVVKVQDYGTKLEAPTPEKEGYTFKGWDSEVPSTMPAENKKYTAQWEINKYNYKIEYYYENESGKIVFDTIKFVLNQLKSEPGDIETELKAEFNQEITKYPTTGKQIDEYYLYKVVYGSKESNSSLKISATEENNVIKVYYIKRRDIECTVNYYLKDTTTKLAESKVIKNQKYGEKITETAKDLRSIGYNAVKENDSVVLDKIKGNELNFYYTPRTDLSCTINYYFNSKLDSSKGYNIDNLTFGSSVDSSRITDHSNNGEWTLNNAKSTALPFTIGVTGNVINVYYSKPVISSTKTATVIGKTSNSSANAENIIKYSVIVKNTGELGTNVNVSDNIPTGTEFVDGSITNSGALNAEKTSINWNNVWVEENSQVELSFNVKLSANTKIGSKINNKAVVKDDKNEKIIAEPEANEVYTDKTVKVNIDGGKMVDKTNITLVLDISSSMEEKVKGVRKIDAAKSTLINFVQKVYSYNVDKAANISIVVFASEEDVATLTFDVNGRKISSDKDEIIAKINSISVPDRFFGTSTHIGSALHEALGCVNNLKALHPDYKNTVVFLGDGEPTGWDSYDISDEANKIKNAGASIYTVAFGMGDSKTLKGISSGNGYYFAANDATELTANYSTILENEGSNIEPVNVTSNEAGKLIINMGTNTLKYPIITKVNGVETSYNSQSSLPAEITIEGNNIVWNISNYNVGTALELTYKIN